MKTSLDKRIYSLLLQNNVISAEKNSELIKQIKGDELAYEELLLRNNIITEHNLLSLLSLDANISPINIDKVKLDEELILSFDKARLDSYAVLPIDKIDNIMTVAIANPYDIVKLDESKVYFGCELRLAITSSAKIKQKLVEVFNPGEQDFEKLLDESIANDIEAIEASDEDEENLAELVKSAEDAPIIKFVQKVIHKALEDKASDIHIEPFEKHVAIRYRKDGVLREVLSPPKKIFNAVVSRIKIMTGLDIAERRVPQDGKFQLKYEGRQIDFRVSTLPTIFGEKVVMRILDSSSITMGLDVLGFEPQVLEAFRRAIATPYGMLLVTGPTGSGKSTTLYSAVKEIMSPEDNVMTVEDPVEYQLEGVAQVPINPKKGVVFASALRAILRQDPNKIMVGEIRDNETAGIAIKAAMTGHLVLSTLHTNDSAAAISRLIDMGADRFLVSSSVILIAAQRLARRLCDICKRPLEKMPAKDRLIEIGFEEKECAKEQTIFRPVGCPRCSKGYKGRFAFLEVLEFDDTIRKLIIQGKPVIDIKDYAVKKGNMITLRRCGILNVLRGKTSIEEVLRMTEK